MSKFSDFLSCRQIVSLMVILAFMMHHMLRVNMAIAIVDMITKNGTNTTDSEQVHFTWNEDEKNDILGCFFWGYLISQIPGGRLSEIFGTKIVLGTSMLLASILTILTPLACYRHYMWVIAARASLGLAMGVQWPSIMPMASRWVAPTDRTKFTSHLMASSLGVALTLPTCGFLIAYLGWPSVFYVTGSITLVWSLAWFCLIYDSPGQHPRIRLTEKEILESEIEDSSAKNLTIKDIPLMKILTSAPVWAIVVANTCFAFTFFLAMNQLPSYMHQVLHFNIKENGMLSGIPYVVKYAMAVLSSYIADRLIKKKTFSLGTIRIIFTTIGFWGPASLFLVQSFWGESRIISVTVFAISLGANGFGNAGFLPNSLDISPCYSGTIFGLANTVASISGYISTKLVATITRDSQEFPQWQYIFWILVGVNVAASFFYCVCASGEVQHWNPKTDNRELKKFRSADDDDEEYKLSDDIENIK